MRLSILLLGVIFVSSIFLKYKKSEEASQEQTAIAQGESASFDASMFDISVNKAALERLKEKRDEALKVGLLFSSKDDFVDANIQSGAERWERMERNEGFFNP